MGSLEQFLGPGGTFRFEMDLLDIPQVVGIAFVQRLQERIVNNRRLYIRRQARGGEEFVLEGNDVLIPAVSLHDRVMHFGLRQFLTEPFDHDDRPVGARDDEVEVASLHLVGRREGDVLALDPGQPDAADRTKEREASENQARRRADHREDVGVILPVGGDRAGLDLNLVAKHIREEGAYRPIDQPGGEDLLGRGSPFALDEAAGEFARGIDFFTVIDGEREEIESFATRSRDRGDECHGIADANHHSATGLFCESSGFNRDDFAPDGSLDGDGSAWGDRRAGHGMYLDSPALVS